MSTPAQVEAIFLAALDRITEAERSGYLDHACGDDAELRLQVERLLKAHLHAADFLGRPAIERLEVAPFDPSEATLGFAPSDPPARPDRPSSEHPESIQTLVNRHDDDGDEEDNDNALAILEPSGKPGSLGRLGHYEIQEVLGKGSFGTVVKALDEKLRRFAAIKLMSPLLAATSAPRKRFLREARSAAAVRHQNVVAIYAVEDKPTPYLVMEYIAGQTLQERLDATGPMDLPDVLRLGRQIAEGLAAAHAMGLIHRDIKPSNILLEHGVEYVKITDFGLARAADDASISRSGLIAGTPMYMAPEQARGELIDHRADLFSLGSVLYVMCTGRPPFRAASTLAVLKRVNEDTPRPIREIIPEVPEWLCDLIARLLAKDPAERFASAQEVADRLAQHPADSQRSGNVPRPSDVPKPAMDETLVTRRPSFPRHRWAAAAAVLAILFGSLGFTEATGVTDVHGTVIRLFSPEGTLLVEVDDPEVSVKVNGSDIVITGAGAREIRLKPGRYSVEASKNGKLVRQELVNVTRDGRPVVRISQDPADTKVANETKTPPGIEGKNLDPDRRAAEYFLSIGGRVQVNKRDRDFINAKDLPREPFRLTLVSLNKTSEITEAGLANFKDCESLVTLDLLNSHVTDAGLANFENCKNLVRLNLLHNPEVSDAGVAHFKDCKNLREVHLDSTQVSDTGLALLKDCKKIVGLGLDSTQVSDAGLALLKDYKNLSWLRLAHTRVSDAGLVHLKDCKNLVYLQLSDTQVSEAGLVHLKDYKNLTELRLFNTKVTAASIDELKKALPRCKIKWDGGVIEPTVAEHDPAAWEASVAAMPADQQVKAVASRLKELNPGFDGAVVPTVEDGVVIGLEFSANQVTDLSPVRALTKLTSLDCSGRSYTAGRLIDLSPLGGLSLTSLNCQYTNVHDLSPLKGMPLETLQCGLTKVSDLSPLKGMKLRLLELQLTPVSDLTPLQGMPLTLLDLYRSKGVSDLKPLQGMSLEYLNLTGCRISDLSVLKGMTSLERLVLAKMPISDLAPLQGLKLKELKIEGTQVSDLALLKTFPLVRLHFDYRPDREEIPRALKGLEWINDKPAAQFWKEVDEQAKDR